MTFTTRACMRMLAASGTILLITACDYHHLHHCCKKRPTSISNLISVQHRLSALFLFPSPGLGTGAPSLLLAYLLAWGFSRSLCLSFDRVVGWGFLPARAQVRPRPLWRGWRERKRLSLSLSLSLYRGRRGGRTLTPPRADAHPQVSAGFQKLLQGLHPAEARLYRAP